MGIEKLLGKIYYNPKEGFMGVNNLFKKAKAKDKTVKLVDVKKWLKKQAVSQVHTRKSEKIEYPYKKIVYFLLKISKQT